MSKCYENYNREELIALLNKQDKELANRKYGLAWDDEKELEKVVLDFQYNLPILEKVSDKEIRTNDSDFNILIEGDNYHSLAVLNYTHKEKIDMIYIDPPYNTGNKDFIYNDKYVDREDGYRHSKWLSFMEKRLNLAKNLLKDSGVIFISIDDNEQSNLKLLCDKIFGEENRVAVLPTIMNLKGNQDEFGFAGTHEYTMVYAKNKKLAHFGEFDLDEDELEEWLEDDKGLYKLGATLKRTGDDAPREKRPYCYYPILVNKEELNVEYISNEEYEKIYNKEKRCFDDDYVNKLKNKYEKLGYSFILPEAGNIKTSWRWQFNKVVNDIEEILVIKSKKGFSLYKKQRPKLGDLPSKKPKTIFYKPEYSSGNGTNRLCDILGTKKFNNPKPVGLIKDFIKIGCNKDACILDFTAGSGTTAEAVMTLNKEDGGNRRFILCTNNENNICTDVCYPRIEKIINGASNYKKGNDIEALGGNLQYLRTAFIKNNKNKEQLKIDLSQKCFEVLCLKEGIFNLKENNEDYKIYESNQKDKYLCIYHNFLNETYEKFLESIELLKGKKFVYLFSLTDISEQELMEDFSDCKVEILPQNMINIYNKIIKDNVIRSK